MMSLDSLDYSNYFYALKSNYRKGVNRLRTLLINPATANDFAANVGGVSVILGWPVDMPDRNSEELLEILRESNVVNTAVLTWFSQFYPEYTANVDTLFGDEARCEEILNNPLLFRAADFSSVLIGKYAVGAAGLNPAEYADMTAVAASSTAMTAVAASSTAMTAVAASSTAMTAIEASSIAIGKYAVGAAGLNPAEYADMTAVAASSTAMTAVAASSTAMTAVAASSTAMTAVAASPISLNAILKSNNARSSFAGSGYLQKQYGVIETTTNNTTYFNKTTARLLDAGSRRAIGGGNTDTSSTPNQSLALIQKMGSYINGQNSTTVIYHLQTNAQVCSETTTSGSIKDGVGITVNKVCIGGCKMTENGDGGAWGVYVYAL